MRRAPRLVAVIAATVLAIGTIPTTVAAQAVTGELIHQLNRELLYIAVPIAVLVEVILFYAVWRFKDNDEPEPTHRNRSLELSWTVATALVLLFVGTASFAVLANPYVAGASTASDGHTHQQSVQPGQAPPDDVEVVVEAQQWYFSYRYPGENVTSDTLVLPTNRTVVFYVTSKDVIHSFSVPALGLKQDAFPGQYNRIETRVVDAGTYRVYCAEYCGRGHATMRSEVRAVGPSEYRTWLDQHRSGAGNETTTTASSGGTNGTANASATIAP